MKQRDDEAQLEIEKLQAMLAAAEKQKQEAIKEVKEKQQSWEVEKGNLSFKVKSSESESATLRDSLLKSSDRVQELEAALSKGGINISLLSSSSGNNPMIDSKAFAAMEKRIKELLENEAQADENVQSVLEDLNQSEAKSEELSSQSTKLRAELLEAQNNLASAREALRLAETNSCFNKEDMQKLMTGKSTDPEVVKILQKCKEDALNSSKAALAKITETNNYHSKIRADLEARIVELVKQVAGLEDAASKVKEVGSLKAENYELKHKLELANLRPTQTTTIVGGSVTEQELVKQIDELNSRLQKEKKERMVLEPKLAQLQTLTGRLEQVEAEHIALTQTHAKVLRQLEDSNEKIARLEEELKAAQALIKDLEEKNKLMLLRPSNKIFRPANWEGSIQQAFAAKVDIENLPQQLRKTDSRHLQTAKYILILSMKTFYNKKNNKKRDEAIRAATPRGEITTHSLSGSLSSRTVRTSLSQESPPPTSPSPNTQTPTKSIFFFKTIHLKKQFLINSANDSPQTFF